MDLTGCSILIVEDDRDTAELYSLALAKLGASVEKAASADEALSRLAGTRFDVVLCDLQLPDEDGYSLLRRIRETPALVDLPVISISASHPEIERERSQRAGFARHVTKPTKLRDIVETIVATRG